MLKDEVLAILKENPESYVSGGNLCGRMKVTRTAIWKAVKELKKEGYEIDSVTGRGYRLLSEPDTINSRILSGSLNTVRIGHNILYFDELGSTNTYSKEIAEKSPEGTVVIAGRQISGRGRIGRTWESNSNSGLYMSVILKPQIPPGELQIITLAASVAVVSALKEAAGVNAGIKWPNDVILDGRKLCGILTEMSSEMDRVNFAVLGIGINLLQEAADFPEELRDKAISLKGYFTEKNLGEYSCRRAEIAKKVTEKLDWVYNILLDGRRQEIIDMWRDMSVTIGREVSISGSGTAYTGRAVDISNDGKLIVLCSDGTQREISSGEVSVRGLLGYAD